MVSAKKQPAWSEVKNADTSGKTKIIVFREDLKETW